MASSVPRPRVCAPSHRAFCAHATATRSRRKAVPTDASAGQKRDVGAVSVAAVHTRDSVVAAPHHAFPRLQRDEREQPVLRGGVTHALGLQVMILGGRQHVECV